MGDTTSRRDFVKVATATAAAATVQTLGARAFAQGGDTIRIGLIGCGGRGNGAVKDNLAVNQGVKLVAIGDLFKDRPVVGIHAVDLVLGFGTLHCLTQQEPALG